SASPSSRTPGSSSPSPRRAIWRTRRSSRSWASASSCCSRWPHAGSGPGAGPDLPGSEAAVTRQAELAPLRGSGPARPNPARPVGHPLRILLISPKGPLYRHRGGIFRHSLRYMPLTLPTLASLVPPELEAEVICVDEGVADVDPGAPADLV